MPEENQESASAHPIDNVPTPQAPMPGAVVGPSQAKPTPAIEDPHAPEQPKTPASETTSPQPQPEPQTQTPPPSEATQRPQNAPAPPPPSAQVGQVPNAAAGQTKPQKSKFGMKPPLLIGLIAAILLIFGGGYYVLAYLPNTPENVWKRGIASVGVGLEELLERDVAQQFEGAKFEGQLTVTKPFELSASFDSTATPSGTGELNFQADWENYKPAVNVFVDSTTQADTALYFKLTGFEALVSDFIGPETFEQFTGGQDVEDIWWSLSSSDLESLGLSASEISELENQTDSEEIVTQEQIKQISAAVIDATNTHLFTENVEESILQVEEHLGSEDFEGQNSEKYLLSISKENLKDYYKALRDNLIATDAWTEIFGDTEQLTDISDDDIDSSVDELDFSEWRIEGWVGADNKILRNVRFTQAEDNSYVELSLLLENDNLDTIPLRLRFAGDDEEATGKVDVTATLDTLNNSASFGVDADVDYKSEFASDINVVVTATYSSLSEAPVLNPPASSRPFLNLFNELAPNYEQVLGESIELF